MVSDAPSLRRSRVVALTASLLALAIGALSLLGWVADNELLKSGLTRNVTIKANTAVGLCLLGTALFLVLLPLSSLLGRQLVRAASALVVAMGALTLSQHVFGWDAGIDQLLFHEPVGALATASPGRMGPPACLGFILLGTGCLLVDSRTAQGRSPAQWLALLAVPLPVLALLGYVTGATELYGIARYTGIALQTAMAFLCLGIALLLARPELKPVSLLVADDPGGQMARSMLPVALLVPVALMWLRQWAEAAGWFDASFGHALLLLALLTIFALIIWRTALRLSSVAAERQRLEAQRALLLESERAARRDAERAVTLKDQFLATLSHELRTPLNAILGWSSILKRVPGRPPDIERPLEVIERNARVQVQLIDDLLDISRIVSGKLRLELELVEVTNVVGAALHAVLPVAEAKKIRVEVDLESEPPVVAGDASRLQQIIWNLLSNAVKFTSEGGRVTVTVRQVEERVELQVSDTGVGIPAAFLPHVFDRFRQADSSTSRPHGGLGLGLSIVKQLVELHGGTVSVSSAGKNQGATFLVTLPLGHEHHRLLTPPPPAFSLSSPALSGLDVLVVDDEPDSRELMGRVLSESQADVRLASSAEEALAELQRRPARVLVSDIGMPGKDGYELIRAVRAHTDAAAMPAVAVTAFAREGDRRRALDAGFQHHLAKPVNPAALVHAIASLVGRTSVESGPDAAPSSTSRAASEPA